MFKSVQGLGSLSGALVYTRRVSVKSPEFPPPPDGKHQYIYAIVDSEFNERWMVEIDQKLNYTEVRAPGALIKCYESKQKNVAYNLYLYHEYMKKRFDWYKLEDEIRYNIEHTPLYMEYAPEVKRIYERMNNLKVFW